MKSMFLALLATVLFAVAPMGASASSPEQDFAFSEHGGTVSKYFGDDEVVVIPSTIGGVKVETLLGTFANNDVVTKVIIPDGVTSIKLNSFRNCINLLSVEIPESVTSIDSYAFFNCTNLSSITIPKKVASIGENAFANCASLTAIVLSENVEAIGKNAFSGCTSLSSITLPTKIKTIESETFLGCSSLSSVFVTKEISKIHDTAFLRCDALVEFEVDPENETYSSHDGLLFNKEKTDLLIYPSSKEGDDYIIPGTIGRIGKYAFRSSMNLTSITIPETIKYIDSSALAYCPSLEKVTLLNGSTYIEDSAFIGNNAAFTMYGIKNSYTELYANKNKIPFKEIEATTGNSTAFLADDSIVFTINTNVAVTNNVLHIGIYNHEEKLVKYKKIPIIGNQPQKQFYVVLDQIEGATKAKVFLWQSFESITPINDAEIIEIQ